MNWTNVELKTGGRLLGDWQRVKVMKSMASISGVFELTVSERFDDGGEYRAPRRGHDCEVLFNGQTVIAGHIDKVPTAANETSHTQTIVGRDAVSLLQKCSAANEPGQWKGRTAAQIIRALVEPFGIEVDDRAPDARPIKLFKIRAGETVLAAIRRVCRLRAILPVAGGIGRTLVLTKAGETKVYTRLEWGVNIENPSVEFDDTDRFSRYIVKAQQNANASLFATDAVSPVGRAEDAGIKTYQPLVIIHDEPATVDELSKIARFEMETRRGRSIRSKVTTPGWSHDNGLWQPNDLVEVGLPLGGFGRRWMLIESVAQTRGALEGEGERTELGLVHPSAYLAREFAETDLAGGLFG